MPSSRTTARSELGIWGESMARWFLTRQGLTITACNVMVDRGEVDILASDLDETVAVEVRTRHGDLSEIVAVDRAKLARMHRNGRNAGANRVDLVVVAINDAGIRMQWSPDL